MAPIIFSEATEKLKTSVNEAIKKIDEQAAMTAYLEDGHALKAYSSRDEARRHRVKVPVGTIIYFPSGRKITTEPGMADLESNNWHYSWVALH